MENLIKGDHVRIINKSLVTYNIIGIFDSMVDLGTDRPYKVILTYDGMDMIGYYAKEDIKKVQISKKETRGGYRKNSGRKPKDPTVTIAFRVREKYADQIKIEIQKIILKYKNKEKKSCKW